MEHILKHFPEYNVNIFGHFNEELMREDIFELTISCEDINKINDGNGSEW